MIQQFKFEKKVLCDEIRDKAVAHINKRLESGGAFSQSVIASARVESGNIYTFLPKDTDQSVVSAFDVGGLQGAFSNSSRTREIVYREIQTHLSMQAGNLVILEDNLSKPSDARLQENATLRSSHLVHEGKIYYHLRQQSVSNDEYKTLVDAVYNCWQFVAIFYSLPKGIEMFIGQKISPATIDDMAQYATTIVVDAYDGESFLFWQPD